MRPQILYPLFAPVSALKGLGPKLAPAVEKVSGPVVRDLLWLAPTRLIMRERATVASARAGTVQTFAVTVDRHDRPGRPGLPWRIRCFDDTGALTLVYFKPRGDGLERSHPRGVQRVVSGKVERFGAEIQIAHPDWLVSADRAAEVPEVESVYPAGAGVSSRQLARFVTGALERAPHLPEWIDPALVLREGWSAWRQSLQSLHSPQSEADLRLDAPARRRLVYDELLAHQLALARRKKGARESGALRCRPGKVTAKVVTAFPFSLTAAQASALAEIRADLDCGRAMMRLLHGDVGSGKTVVALLAGADVAGAGAQTALMAPTEILARQHFDRLAPMLSAAGVQAVLLTGRDRGAIRAGKLEAIRSGAASFAIGTHALFQEDVAFQRLALAIVDEQHRFGVRERQRLKDKGYAVHILSMSATPIPRTLELTQYGDLDVSRLQDKPPGRKPILTRAAPIARLESVVARLDSALKAGAQAYWICPLVSESELNDIAAAQARAEFLRQRLGATVGLAHGQMPATERDEAMTAFAAGGVRALVATTIVEVGVDVPNATIMVIEHAERFGLAQLHQLRGRVGRGPGESACILLYDPPLAEAALARLDILRQTEDGFLIAEEDLRLRQGGDVLGLKQSGVPAYRLADLEAHRDLLLIAAQDARNLLRRDPSLSSERGEAARMLSELYDWRAESSDAPA